GERLFPGMKIGDGVMTSHEALINDRLPKSLAVIGAGAVGLEFAYFYRAFGVEVTVIELEKQMLPGFDAEIAEELRREFIKRGVNVMLGHGYKSIEKRGGSWSITLDAGGQSASVEAETVLVAVGRVPLSAAMGLDRAGVEIGRGGFITIDESFGTSAPSV